MNKVIEAMSIQQYEAQAPSTIIRKMSPKNKQLVVVLQGELVQ